LTELSSELLSTELLSVLLEIASGCKGSCNILTTEVLVIEPSLTSIKLGAAMSSIVEAEASVALSTESEASLPLVEASLLSTKAKTRLSSKALAGVASTRQSTLSTKSSKVRLSSRTNVEASTSIEATPKASVEASSVVVLGFSSHQAHQAQQGCHLSVSKSHRHQCEVRHRPAISSNHLRTSLELIHSFPPMNHSYTSIPVVSSSN